MKTAYFLKIAYCSGNIMEKQVVSNTTKFSSESNWLMKYSAVCVEYLDSTPELPKQYLLSEKSNTSQKWNN